VVSTVSRSQLICESGFEKRTLVSPIAPQQDKTVPCAAARCVYRIVCAHRCHAHSPYPARRLAAARMARYVTTLPERGSLQQLGVEGGEAAMIAITNVPTEVRAALRGSFVCALASHHPGNDPSRAWCRGDALCCLYNRRPRFSVLGLRREGR